MRDLLPACPHEPVSPDLPPDRPVVLIVDDTPDNLALLSDTLHAAGYAVLVALDGESALHRLARFTPDAVLMDAVMPGMDGFETCRRLKLDAARQHLPVIFMTALADSEHVVRGFRVGGIDYVTKPVKPDEVCARIAAHVQRSRAQQHANVMLGLDARATLIVTADGTIRWHSRLALERLARHPDAPDAAPSAARLPLGLHGWFVQWIDAGQDKRATYELTIGSVRHVARMLDHAARGEWVMLLEEFDDASHVSALAARFGLTTREAEVLLWITRGKTNRDIGDILGMATRTVNKHLEHVFDKLNVETRAAAAAVALKTGHL
ncbi:response regulator transcription factor [Burkholderia sp. Ac-20344]|uniref:response regulator transcription factor n=1 Tax=Burkholderia sp. Ac-20344 TaxID=2703890 RepID=UPI00197CB34C|nr:response regulator transcription factor [Burkholderia sp. Ac-20344]MBN3835240.1 response regulator transcription factor [Burkholderia sp. Ac-20344]